MTKEAPTQTDARETPSQSALRIAAEDDALQRQIEELRNSGKINDEDADAMIDSNARKHEMESATGRPFESIDDFQEYDLLITPEDKTHFLPDFERSFVQGKKYAFHGHEWVFMGIDFESGEWVFRRDGDQHGIEEHSANEDELPVLFPAGSPAELPHTNTKSVSVEHQSATNEPPHNITVVSKDADEHDAGKGAPASQETREEKEAVEKLNALKVDIDDRRKIIHDEKRDDDTSKKKVADAWRVLDQLYLREKNIAAGLVGVQKLFGLVKPADAAATTFYESKIPRKTSREERNKIEAEFPQGAVDAYYEAVRRKDRFADELWKKGVTRGIANDLYREFLRRGKEIVWLQDELKAGRNDVLNGGRARKALEWHGIKARQPELVLAQLTPIIEEYSAIPPKEERRPKEESKESEKTGESEEKEKPRKNTPLERRIIKALNNKQGDTIPRNLLEEHIQLPEVAAYIALHPLAQKEIPQPRSDTPSAPELSNRRIEDLIESGVGTPKAPIAESRFEIKQGLRQNKQGATAETTVPAAEAPSQEAEVPVSLEAEIVKDSQHLMEKTVGPFSTQWKLTSDPSHRKIFISDLQIGHRSEDNRKTVTMEMQKAADAMNSQMANTGWTVEVNPVTATEEEEESGNLPPNEAVVLPEVAEYLAAHPAPPVLAHEEENAQAWPWPVSGQRADTTRSAESSSHEFVGEVEIGKIYEGKVLRVLGFGAVVEIMPGKEGLLHISQIAEERFGPDRWVVPLKEGEVVDVRVRHFDEKGRPSFTMKDASTHPAPPVLAHEEENAQAWPWPVSGQQEAANDLGTLQTQYFAKRKALTEEINAAYGRVDTDEADRLQEEQNKLDEEYRLAVLKFAPPQTPTADEQDMRSPVQPLQENAEREKHYREEMNEIDKELRATMAPPVSNSDHRAFEAQKRERYVERHFPEAAELLRKVRDPNLPYPEFAKLISDFNAAHNGTEIFHGDGYYDEVAWRTSNGRQIHFSWNVSQGGVHISWAGGVNDDNEDRGTKKEVTPLNHGVVKQFETKFAITENMLQQIEAFKKLESPGKQLLVLKNLEQIALSDIQKKAQAKQKEEWGGTPWYKKAFKQLYSLGMNPEHRVAELQKEILAKYHGGASGDPEHEMALAENLANLEQLAKVAAEGPEVNATLGGGLEMVYVSGKDLFESNEDPAITPEFKKRFEEFNAAASEFAKFPREWGYETERPGVLERWLSGDRRRYEAAKGRYEEVCVNMLEFYRDRFAEEIAKDPTRSKEDPEQGALYAMNAIDERVQLNQLFNSHPDAEKALQQVEDQNTIVAAAREFWKSKGMFIAGGALARWGTIAISGGVMLPAIGLIGAGVGGLIGTAEGKQLMKAKRADGRMSEEDLREEIVATNKKTGEVILGKDGKPLKRQIKEYTDATFFADRIDRLSEKLSNTTEPAERALLEKKIAQTVVLMNEQFDRGMINFGGSSLEGGDERRGNTIANRLSFIQAMALGQMYITVDREALETRFEEIMGLHQLTIEEKRKKEIRKIAAKSALIRGAFALAGAGIVEGVKQIAHFGEPGYFGSSSGKMPPGVGVQEAVQGGAHSEQPAPGVTGEESAQAAPSAADPSPHAVGPEDFNAANFDKNIPRVIGRTLSPEELSALRSTGGVDVHASANMDQHNALIAEMRESQTPLTTEQIEAIKIRVDEMARINREAAEELGVPPATESQRAGDTPETLAKLEHERTWVKGDTGINELRSERAVGDADIEKIFPYVVSSDDNLTKIITRQIPGATENDVQNVLKNLSSEQWKALGIESGDPHLIQPGEVIDLNKIQELIGSKADGGLAAITEDVQRASGDARDLEDAELGAQMTAAEHDATWKEEDTGLLTTQEDKLAQGAEQDIVGGEGVEKIPSYEVKSGDTLYRVLEKQGTTPKSIMETIGNTKDTGEWSDYLKDKPELARLWKLIVPSGDPHLIKSGQMIDMEKLYLLMDKKAASEFLEKLEASPSAQWIEGPTGIRMTAEDIKMAFAQQERGFLNMNKEVPSEIPSSGGPDRVVGQKIPYDPENIIKIPLTDDDIPEKHSGVYSI